MKKTNRVFILCAVLIILIMSSTASYGQLRITRIKKLYWVDVGLGRSSVGEGGCFNLKISYQSKRSRNIFAFRMAFNGVILEKHLDDYDFLYNYAFTSGKLLTSLGSGLSIVAGRISTGLFDDDSKKIEPIIGLPVLLEFVWRPFRFMGIGLSGYANFNKEENFTSLTLNLYFGWLR